MKKKQKIITSILGAAALGSGIAIATAAQACGPRDTPDTPIPETNQVVAENAILELNGATSPTALSASAQVLYNAIQNEIVTLSTSDTVISSITIQRTDLVTVTDNGATITISVGEFIVNTTGNGNLTYSNTENDLILSNITFQDSVIITVGGVSNLLQLPSNGEVGETALRALNGLMGNSVNDASQQFLINALQDQIRSLDSDQTNIASIIITTPESSVSTSDNGVTLSVSAGTVTITTTGGAANTYVNSTTVLSFSNVVYSGPAITGVGTVGGLEIRP